ncbi:hypothetical protein BKA58DRAFT_398277 [Alternaria rosae]|uniref:uncharacterized protein n=1 Tax=Alternaria rosae TaxID=1187941 RepID=UPI001E8D7F7E|nr:uncharacterized protein BKA58DRAFT_398277 [Alternaria rosae]KAH6878193.1 hypothetical protein BKA58DRAFT_398277 [Alternaria rosae]
MNSGNFIILLTATFPALAISSFLFSLATYFRPPGAHSGTQDRLGDLEDMEDIIPALIQEVGALRRSVDRERQRTRRLEDEVRYMGRRQRRNDETADEGGDEAEMKDDEDEEVQMCHLGELLVRNLFDVNEFLEGQRARELACRTIQRSRLNRTCGSDPRPANGIPDELFHVPSVYKIRGRSDSILDDEEALEAAAATALPSSPEEDSESTNEESSTLTQTIHQGRGEETSARMLVGEDMSTLLTSGESHTPTTNGHSRMPHLDTADYHAILITPSPMRQRPNILYPSPRGPTPTRIVIRNDPGGLWRRNFLTDVLTDTTPQLEQRIILTIIENYLRSFEDSAVRHTASTNGNARHAVPSSSHTEPTRLTTNMPNGERHAHQTNGYTYRHTHTPSTNDSIQYPSLPNGHGNSSPPPNNSRFNGYIYEPTTDDSNQQDYAEARQITRPLFNVLYAVRPFISSRVIRDIIIRYIIAMDLGYTDPENSGRIRLTTAADQREGVNGVVDDEGVEDLSEDVWMREPNNEYQTGTSRGSGRGMNDNRNGIINTFHINGGIVTQNNTSLNGAPLTNDRTHTSNAYTRAPSPERLTTDPEDIRSRSRLSTPELNEAIGNWGSISRTLDGPVLRLRAIRAEGALVQDSHLRPHADTGYGGRPPTDARPNGYATATQLIPPSVYVGNGTSSSSESSTRSSRSASLSGTTLVNSAVGSTDGDAVVTPNPPIDGETSDNVELFRNGAYETHTARLRRRRGTRNMRRAAREDARVERESVEEESSGTSKDSMDVDIAEVEAARWSLRNQRGTMEEEMMRHVLERDRAAQAQQANSVEMNGVGSERSDETSEVSETRERRLNSE